MFEVRRQSFVAGARISASPELRTRNAEPELGTGTMNFEL
jgi:hypothetical protein